MSFFTRNHTQSDGSSTKQDIEDGLNDGSLKSYWNRNDGKVYDPETDEDYDSKTGDKW